MNDESRPKAAPVNTAGERVQGKGTATIPHVPATRVPRTRNTIEVTCPYCERRHRHGNGAPGGTRSRIAHCGRGSYVLGVVA